MALQYINVPENDFGRGIDARSTENQIGEGFVRDLLNADVIQKSVRKRTGYESYAGNIPVRATRLDYISPNKMYLTLDSVVSLNTTVSLESVRSSPLVIYGRTSSSATGSGPITSTDSAHYFNKFVVPLRKQFLNGSHTLDIPGTEHGLGSTNFFCNVVEAVGTSGKNYKDIYVNSLGIDTTTYDLAVNYDYTETATSTDVIVYYLSRVAATGEVFKYEAVHPGGGSHQFNIDTSLHNLNNYNIVYKIYEITNSGNTWLEVEADLFTIDNLGNVKVVINSNDSATYEIILSAAPTANTIEGDITTPAVLTNLSHPWIFYNIYVQKEGDPNVYERVEADTVIYDETTNTLSFTFDTTQGIAYKIFYEYGDIRSNVLEVQSSGITTGTDYFPQVTIWGLDHSEIYTTKSAREGWTTHIDTYRRSGEQRVIAGLGGNLFAARDFNELVNPTTSYYSQYKYAHLYPSLYSRTSAALSIGPLFYDTGDIPNPAKTLPRSRGYITTDIGGTGQVSVTSVAYEDSLSGFEGTTKYTLSVPSMNIIGTLSTMISTTSGLEDWLTVSNMSYKRHEGTFKIVKVQQPVDQDSNVIPDILEIWVENSQNNSSDWNDLNTGGYAGIFTDQVTWLSNSNYIPQDTLLLTGQEFATVYSSKNTTTVCGPFTSLQQVASGVLLTGQRTSSVVPMREALPTLTPSVENLVRGDMISYTGIDRYLRVLYINPDINREVTIEGDGTTATVTMSNTSYLAAGQKILLVGAGNYSGVQTISDILSAEQFTFNSTHTDTISSAILSGKTVEIDESLTWKDTAGDQAGFLVDRRWIPIEAPDDNYNLTPTTYVRHFDSAQYSAQPFIRSTMVADNLYLTNGSDEVMKFDGQNIYRAGLPAWQPGLFVTVDTSVGVPKIVIPVPRSMTYTVANSGDLTNYKKRGELPIDAANMNIIPVGTQVIVDGITSPYTIRGYEDKSSGGGSHVIQFDRGLDDSTPLNGTISEIVGAYKYYFRLNAIDANDNIIASAMTSSEDTTVRMSQNAAIHLKLVGMPALDNYDYDRIEVEIYRTKLLPSTLVTAPSFYKIVTLGNLTSPAVSFNNTAGYLEYVDTNSDSDIALVANLDPLSTQAGSELGIGWSDPLRAKYITTTNNRLVLGNVKDYPEFDIQIESSTDLIPSTFNGHNLVFRKDSSDTESSSNMVDRVKFEWTTTASSVNVTGITGTLNTSFTVTVANSAAVGDWVYLYYSSPLTTGQPLQYAGWWQIASRSSSSITINCVTAGSNSPAVRPNKAIFASSGAVPVLLGTDGNLGQINGDFLGSTSDKFDATRRLALAINSVMRMTDKTIPSMSSFQPWLIARGGNDVSRAGQIIVRAPYQSDVLPSVEAAFNTYALYVNSLPIKSTTVDPQARVSASEKIYPSRILVSYQNYPELFDTPTAILDSDSISAIDINPADGQEITGVIPFFGEAAFTAAQQAGILVVFKTNSIYLVDINQKVSGSNLVVQRLETQGLGCTAPYSISVTKNGIMFANNSGIYCLRRNQAIEYIGKFMERNWVNRVDRDVLALAQGHHYGVGRMYKLSVPILGTEDTATGYIEPSEVYVYNHTQEDEEQHLGAWSRYDNHTAIGWANLASDAFWASTGGKVYALRTTGSETDFRDSNQPIIFRLDTRPNDYGNSGIRKVLDKVIASYRTGNNTASNNMYFSVDLEQEYSATTPFRVAGTTENLTGFDDEVQKDIITLRHSLDRRKGVYFSIRIENSNLDENVEIAGVDYRVGGMDSKGIKSASKT